MGFWPSILALSLVQGAVVALPGRPAPAWTRRLRGRGWFLVPAASLVGVIALIRATSGSASALTWLALVAVPPLAAWALGGLVRGAAPAWSPAAAALFALAWAEHGRPAGDLAGLALICLACVTLAVLLHAVTPPALLRAGIAVTALADVALVVSDLLSAPNAVLDAAAPPAALPQLQRAALGPAFLGFGDLFVAALLGALLRGEGPRRQAAGALAVAALACALDLLFLALDELPATVPVALALAIGEVARRRSPGRAG